MRKYLLYIFSFFLLFIIFPAQSSVFAASFGFDKETAQTESGGTIQLQVTIDGGTDEISSADAYVVYDSDLLTVESVTEGTFLPTVSSDTTTEGKIYIAGMVDDPATSKTGTGTLATITFNAAKDGDASISYDCNSSKIIKNDLDATNVLECTKNGSSVITVGSGSSSTNSNTNTSNITELPKSGILENVIKYAVPGMVLLLIGAGAKLLL